MSIESLEKNFEFVSEIVPAPNKIGNKNESSLDTKYFEIAEQNL